MPGKRHNPSDPVPAATPRAPQKQGPQKQEPGKIESLLRAGVSQAGCPICMLVLGPLALLAVAFRHVRMAVRRAVAD